MLPFSDFGKDTGTGALPFKSPQSTVKRLVIFNPDFGHL